MKKNRLFLLIVVFFAVITSCTLWSFNTWVKWQWLTTHSNRLVLYIAVQVAIIFIAIRFFIAKSGMGKEFIDYSLGLAAIIIPLLAGSGKDTSVKSVNEFIRDTVPSVTTTLPKKKRPAKPDTFKDNRLILLSGIVLDAETGESLDSVIISINSVLACYSDQWGKFNAKQTLAEFFENTIVLYQKPGYKDATVSYYTPVRNENINLNGQKITLNKK